MDQMCDSNLSFVDLDIALSTAHLHFARVRISCSRRHTRFATTKTHRQHQGEQTQADER